MSIVDATLNFYTSESDIAKIPVVRKNIPGHFGGETDFTLVTNYIVEADLTDFLANLGKDRFLRSYLEIDMQTN